MWKDLPEPWKLCFEEAWEAYCCGSIPIGAVVVDHIGNVISKGRNRVNEKEAPNGTVSWNKLAHAELNALLQVSEYEHQQIKDYTLYTTVEPCPLCFGALVMSKMRNLRYAARDRLAGATNLTNSFIRERQLSIQGPYPDLEVISIALNTDYTLRMRSSNPERILNPWMEDCPKGVLLGKRWYENDRLIRAKANGESISLLVDEVAAASFV